MLFWDDNKTYKCLIKHDSGFSMFWESVMAIAFSISFWIIPLNIATNYEAIYDLETIEKIITFLIAFDIVINFVSEKVKDTEIIQELK